MGDSEVEEGEEGIEYVFFLDFTWLAVEDCGADDMEGIDESDFGLYPDMWPVVCIVRG